MHQQFPGKSWNNFIELKLSENMTSTAECDFAASTPGQRKQRAKPRKYITTYVSFWKWKARALSHLKCHAGLRESFLAALDVHRAMVPSHGMLQHVRTCCNLQSWCDVDDVAHHLIRQSSKTAADRVVLRLLLRLGRIAKLECNLKNPYCCC